ncbi:MAG: hypothetical protein CSA63_00445 [Propionibacterium sp.]|nr:MAG: hypothetical protein CSA63_00445 [Propionibacterium sp.]
MKLGNKSRIGLAVASLLIVSVGVDGWVGSLAGAAPATLSFGSVEARLHRLSNEADQYRFVAPAADPVADWTDWVADGAEARVAHGAEWTTAPTELDTDIQSVIGLTPYTPTTVIEGEPFLLAKLTHYNNPIVAIGTNKHSSTTAEFNIDGQILSMSADLWETPSNANCPAELQHPDGCLDVFSFDDIPADGEITFDGKRFKLVLDGFRISETGTCPVKPEGELTETFITVENTSTYGCLYAQFEKVPRLTISVNTQLPNGAPVPAAVANAEFSLTSDSELAYSNWPGPGFTLQAGQTEAHDLYSAEKLVVSEYLPADGKWELLKLECVDENGAPIGADESGNGVTINNGKLTIDNVIDMATTPDEINCTYTNVYDDGSRGYSVAKTADPATGGKILPGDVVTYTVQVTPAAGGARDVVVHDDLSGVLDKAELVAGSINPSVGDASVVGTDLTWNVGDIAGYQAGEQPTTLTLTYQVKIAEGVWAKQVHNAVAVDSPDPCLGDCEPSTDHRLPGFRLYQTSDPAPGSTLKPGDIVTYTMHTRNIAPVGLTDGIVTDDLGPIFDVADWVGFVGDSQGATLDGNMLNWKFDTLPVNGEKELRYQVRIRADYNATSMPNLAVAGEQGECEPPGCATNHKLAPIRPKMPETGADPGQDGAALLWLPVVALAFALRKRR